MVTLVKHEWHQVDSQFAFEIDEDILGQIYPDLDEQEIADLLSKIESGEADVADIVNDAYNEGVEIEWERQYDDWWTERKGGYDVSYELGDETSWHTAPTPALPTHQCTNCRWKGSSYETSTQYCRADGSVIENYLDSDEESDHTKDICPMCDSDVKLTPAGEEKEREFAELQKRLAADDEDDDTDEDDDEDQDEKD